MHLHMHIVEERGTRLSAFLLISLLTYKMPNLSVEVCVCMCVCVCVCVYVYVWY